MKIIIAIFIILFPLFGYAEPDPVIIDKGACVKIPYDGFLISENIFAEYLKCAGAQDSLKKEITGYKDEIKAIQAEKTLVMQEMLADSKDFTIQLLAKNYEIKALIKANERTFFEKYGFTIGLASGLVVTTIFAVIYGLAWN